MDAESKELLREWLIRSLEPVCDADPEVLSKYVLALIQNDPAKEGLRETCIAKLEEFLGDETAPFVSRLFVALETGAYRNDGGATRASQDTSEAAAPRVHAHEHQHHAHGGDRDDASRRRGRASSDDEDEHRRFSKRRRDDEYARDDRRFSPRRGGDQGGGRRDGYAGARNGGRGSGGGRGGGSNGGNAGEWERDAGRDRGYPVDRRRNYPGPEWGMPPPQSMGMWAPPPGHYPPPRGAYPPHPMGDFDPNAYNPESGGMMPPPHPMGMMMPRHMGGGAPYYPYPGGRGRGRGGFHGGRSIGGAGAPKPDEGAASGAAGPDSAAVGGAPAPIGARTTLRVGNVDPKYVNMTKLSLHFSKFGNVVNVQMRPNHRCAYVQYATEDEAKKAFHSPIPVCNNRFIEVKWARYDPKDPLGAPSEEAEDAKSTEEDSADPTTKNATNSTAATMEDAAVPEKEMTSEELRAAALEKGRKVLEEKRELLEKQRQLMKQKEELLKRQLAQQKELLERMSQNSASVSVADKRDLLNKITALSEELKALQPRRDSGDQGKLSGLKAELSALEEAAASTAGAPFAGRGRGGGRWGAGRGGSGYYRGGGRAGAGGRGGRASYAHYSNTLDNRTTIVKVENLPEEARDASVLEQHFGNFGGVERVIVDDSAPTRGFIKFQDRYAGQAALARGGMYGQTKLELSWVDAQDAPAELAPTTPSAAAQGGQDAISSGPSATNTETTEVSASA